MGTGEGAGWLAGRSGVPQTGPVQPEQTNVASLTLMGLCQLMPAEVGPIAWESGVFKRVLKL